MPFCLKLLSYLCSYVGLSIIVVAYVVCGGIFFHILESSPNDEPRRLVLKNRDALMEEMWTKALSATKESQKALWENETRGLVKVFEQQMYSVISNDRWDGQPVGSSYTEWDVAGSVLFSICLITTIGYGNIAPRTDEGKILTIVYSVIGIPLFLVFLANIGFILANAFRLCFSSSVKRVGNKKTEGKVKVPIIVALLVIVGYVLIGALLFTGIEQDWSFLTSAYFVFVTLSTIGLGDYVAGLGTGYQHKGVLIFSLIYIIFGMALTAMVFNLIKVDVMAKFGRIKKFLTFVPPISTPKPNPVPTNDDKPLTESISLAPEK